jgi:RNA polymerase sigma-70 factor (ECF subfamily)
MLEKSDAELIEVVLAGDSEAFSALVRRYERPVRAAAMNIVHDRHLADDAAQEAFVKAYQKLAGLRKPSVFGSWLFKITRRCAIDLLRRRPDETSIDYHSELADHRGNGRLDARKQRLLEAVVKLPGAQRQLIMLRYFSGYSLREVSEITSRPTSSITKALSRIHLRLRRHIEGLYQ